MPFTGYHRVSVQSALPATPKGLLNPDVSFLVLLSRSSMRPTLTIWHTKLIFSLFRSSLPKSWGGEKKKSTKYKTLIIRLHSLGLYFKATAMPGCTIPADPTQLLSRRWVCVKGKLFTTNWFSNLCGCVHRFISCGQYLPKLAKCSQWVHADPSSLRLPLERGDWLGKRTQQAGLFLRELNKYRLCKQAPTCLITWLNKQRAATGERTHRHRQTLGHT